MAERAPSIEDEIQQSRPFRTVQERTLISLLRTADRVDRAMSLLLKEHGLSQPQYNVLRILRGAGPEGHTCSAIGERMVTRVPDVTRLVDRLISAGLVERQRCPHDRRVVHVRLLPEGRAVVDDLDAPIEAQGHQLLGHLEPEELDRLVELLDRARSRMD